MCLLHHIFSQKQNTTAILIENANRGRKKSSKLLHKYKYKFCAYNHTVSYY